MRRGSWVVSRSLCRTIRGRGKIDPILVPDPAQVAEMLAPVLTGNDLILVHAGCGVNALSGIKNIANSIYCRNLVGLISGAHQAVLRLSSVSNAINP